MMRKSVQIALDLRLRVETACEELERAHERGGDVRGAEYAYHAAVGRWAEARRWMAPEDLRAQAELWTWIAPMRRQLAGQRAYGG